MTIEPDRIASALAYELRRRGVTQRQAAAEIGVLRPCLSTLLSQCQPVGLVTARKIARWMGVPVSVFCRKPHLAR
jgi:plasmid maintenance system antidote protein VapI